MNTENTQNYYYQIALLLSGITPTLFLQLEKKFPNLQELFYNCSKFYTEKKIPETIYKKLQKPNKKKIEQHIQWGQKEKCHLIYHTNSLFPQNLKLSHSYPPFLFVKGNIHSIKQNQIAIVGSRNATFYGLDISRKLSYELAINNYTITSGLAIGIDTQAHYAALSAKKSTIAVVGLDIENIYPKQNTTLYHRIIEQGAIVSEMPLASKYNNSIFPRRNRIISALSNAVIVVEATKKSGALITANYAIEQNKELMAVPGKINQKQAEGCNQLIQQGAHLVQNIDDILKIIK